ncbi:MAG: hypothetical protein IPN67_14475 [Bacteroidales bacterium]|nr:hypothetical protein [Bacteroidales bacterium]
MKQNNIFRYPLLAASILFVSVFSGLAFSGPENKTNSTLQRQVPMVLRYANKQYC